jgi:hypothetical protein
VVGGQETGGQERGEQETGGQEGRGGGMACLEFIAGEGWHPATPPCSAGIVYAICRCMWQQSRAVGRIVLAALDIVHVPEAAWSMRPAAPDCSPYMLQLQCLQLGAAVQVCAVLQHACARTNTALTRAALLRMRGCRNTKQEHAPSSAGGSCMHSWLGRSVHLHCPAVSACCTSW